MGQGAVTNMELLLRRTLVRFELGGALEKAANYSMKLIYLSSSYDSQ